MKRSSKSSAAERVGTPVGTEWLTAAAPKGMVTLSRPGTYFLRTSPVYVEMTVTASEFLTMRSISGANVFRSGPLQLSSDEKNVETRAALEARFAAMAKIP